MAATKKSLKGAFVRFVDLLDPIEDVRHVVAFEDSLDIFVYITAADEEVCYRIFHVEHQLRDEYPGLDIDFHIRFMDGRELESFVKPLPRLVFHRAAA